MVMRRRVIRELLDDDSGSEADVAESLVDLRKINDWFGGTRATAVMVRRVVERTRSSRLSLLEVGAGAGDLPSGAARMVAKDGIELRVTLLDRMWSHLPPTGIRVAGDALRLPFMEGSFDVVSCSLFAHHFEAEQLLQFSSEALRVCRHAVLINDLIRSRLHLALVYGGLPFFRSRITWHDAPASVRRAYTCEEIIEILSGLPVADIESSRHYLYRMGVVLWKRSSGLD